MRNNSETSRKSLGFMTEEEINLWGSDAKLKARLHQKRMNMSAAYKNKNDVANEEEMRGSINTSINRLREKTKNQISNSLSLNNHLKYLQVDASRKQKMIDIAKYKYYRMIQFRNRSVIEKQELSRQRQRLIQRHKKSVSMRASRIKIERNNSATSSKIWRDKNQSQATKIKNIKVANQRFLAQRKQTQIAQNKSLVLRQRRISLRNREALNKSKEQKFLQAKRKHDEKLLQQFTKSQMQKKKNQKLLILYNQKVKQLEERRARNFIQLSSYKEGLEKFHGRRKTKSRDFFYMTS